jgi:hypothetical protein
MACSVPSKEKDAARDPTEPATVTVSPLPLASPSGGAHSTVVADVHAAVWQEVDASAADGVAADVANPSPLTVMLEPAPPEAAALVGAANDTAGAAKEWCCWGDDLQSIATPNAVAIHCRHAIIGEHRCAGARS